MNYPDKTAYMIAQKLRKFRAESEQFISSEINVNADEQMRNVVRQIDWKAYNDIINQLEFTYKQRKNK